MTAPVPRLLASLALLLGACSGGAHLVGQPDGAASSEAGGADVAPPEVAAAADAAPETSTGAAGQPAAPDASADWYDGPVAGGGVAWSAVNKQPAAWYGGPAALELAANIIYYQNADGGWPKNIDMTTRAAPLDRSTIDNNATTTQLIFLARVATAAGDGPPREAFLRGVDYLLAAQYPNGGWPQFYPEAKGYQTHITFNDGATVHVLELLRAIGRRAAPYAFVDEARAARGLAAVARGIDCILACQIVEDGVKTGWCAQHDEVTLAPALARTYELPSRSGFEGAGLLAFLMTVDPPTPAIVEAVQAGIRWFKSARLTGLRVKRIADATQPSGADVVVVPDATAPPLWARFYELGTDRPFFCDRDGVPKYSLDEIGNERRTGYDWYTDEPTNTFTVYASWQPKWAPGMNALTP